MRRPVALSHDELCEVRYNVMMEAKVRSESIRNKAVGVVQYTR